MKKIIITLILLQLATATILAQSTSTILRDAKLRESSNSSSKIICVIPKGTEIVLSSLLTNKCRIITTKFDVNHNPPIDYTSYEFRSKR